MPPELQSQGALLAWTIQIGGPLFTALLIMSFFYRKDFLRAIKDEEQKNKAMLEIIIANTAAQQATKSEIALLRAELEARSG